VYFIQHFINYTTTFLFCEIAFVCKSIAPLSQAVVSREITGNKCYFIQNGCQLFLDAIQTIYWYYLYYSYKAIICSNYHIVLIQILCNLCQLLCFRNLSRLVPHKSDGAQSMWGWSGGGHFSNTWKRFFLQSTAIIIMVHSM
jgi:hypothetical protein